MTRTSRRRWGIEAALALSLGACVTPAGYRGTGVLNISGQPALLTEVSVKIATCRRPASEDTTADNTGPLGGPNSDAVPGSYSVLSIGPGCRIPGYSSSGTFLSAEPATCTIGFAEGPQTMRVTSASIRLYHGGVCSPAAQCGARVQFAGRDVATGKYLVFGFEGRGIDTDPDPTSCPFGQALQASPVASPDEAPARR